MFSTTVSAVASPKSRATQKTLASAKPTAAPAGDWLREWNSSVVATATAVSALVFSEQHGSVLAEIGTPDGFDPAYQGDLSELIVSSVHWLARQQHTDGGFSGANADRSTPGDMLTTIMVRSALQLTGAPAAYPELVNGMNRFIKCRGGLEHLRTAYGPLNSGAILVQGTSALTEALDSREMPTIPLETAPLENSAAGPEFWAGRDSVTPALVALGMASYHFSRPYNPLTLWRRGRANRLALGWLVDQQHQDGGFCNSVPVTSLVVLSLASIGQSTHPIVRRGVEYLFSNLSEEGCWYPHPTTND